MNRKQREWCERVDKMLAGLEAVSTGLCPGCDECRSNWREYQAVEHDDSPLPDGWTEAWTVPAIEGSLFATEELAEAAAREAFEDDWSAGHVYSEPSFSRSPCDICSSPLGGDREDYHYILDGRTHHDSGACVDCVCYLANGDVPDLPDGKLEKHRDSAGELPSFAWPGGYQIVYVLGDGALLCPDCANGENGSEASDDPDMDAQWRLDDLQVHEEGPAETCAHCGKAIESAYGDPEADKEGVQS